MNQNEPSSNIIERFVADGVENSLVDVKSKEITESTAGRKKLIKRLAAFANQEGGTVIIGVRRQENGEVLFQPFDPDNEVRQYLTDIAREYTRPPISDLWRIEFIQHSGARLLRIDVNEAEERPILYIENGKGTAYIRAEDTTVQMTQQEIIDFYESRSQRRDMFEGPEVSLSERISLTDRTDAEVPSFDAPEGRIVTSIQGPRMVVFSGNTAFDPIGKSVTFHLETRLPVATPSDIETLLSIAHDEVQADPTDFHLGYTIKSGDRQLHGRGIESLLNDMGNIRVVISLLESAHETGSRSEHATTGDPRPIVVGQTHSNFGTFWFETQWRGGTYDRGKCGFILEDIPFDDTALHSFFEQIDAEPRTYKHERGLHMLVLRGGQQPLSNPTPQNLTPDYYDSPLHVIADNPAFQRKDDVLANAEQDIPDYFLDTICSVNRLPYQVSGGYREEDETFSLNLIDMLYKGLMQTTLFVNPMCWAETKDEDEIALPFAEMEESSKE